MNENNDNSNRILKKDKPKYSIFEILLTTIFTISFIIQIVLMFIYYNELRLTFLLYIGFIFWIFSIYFGFIPFRTLKKRGKVEKGKSYIKTTKLVDEGPYAIVRHPQYLAGILFTISITLWTQVWLSLILTIIIIILTYQWTYTEERLLIDKFGDDYIAYKKNVSRLNIIVGLIKYMLRQKK
ncbi:MAG: methyltransferase family protein [Candidatus Thorarchaeota archaeon]